MQRLLALLMIATASASPLHAAEGVGAVYPKGLLALVFVGIAFVVGAMSLIWEFGNRYKGKAGFWSFAWNKPLVKLALGCLGLVLLMNVLLGNDLSENRYENLEFAKLRKISRLGASINRELATEFPYIAHYHYDYIAAYHEEDAWEQTGGISTQRDDEQLSPTPYYQRLLSHGRANLQDYGYLGMGISEYFESMPNLAYRQLMLMRDTAIPYRNLFLGRIHRDWGMPTEAAYYFHRELEVGGARQLAARDYASLVYHDRRDSIEQLRALVEDAEIGPHVPAYMARNLYVREGALGAYMALILSEWWNGLNWIGLLGALLGVWVWAGFLRKVEGRQRYAWPVIALVVATGGLFCFLALPLYDYLEFVFDFKETGDPWQDFLFCWFGIGVVEEFVKFLPLLLLWRTTRLLQTPLDFIIYASLIALGFAFVENLVYFDSGNENILHARLLTAVVIHVFLSATVAFAIVLARYRFQRGLIPITIAGFMFAALLHGLYDFVILNHSAHIFIFLTYGLLLYATFQFAAYLNNGLNHLSHYNAKHLPDPNKLAESLLIGLVGILMFEFMSMALIYGPMVATGEFLQSLTVSSFLMFFLVLNLTNIDVVRGEWVWVRPWSFQSRRNYNSAVGKRLELLAGRRESVLNGMLPARGEVIGRISVAGDNGFFLFEFDQPAVLLGHPLRYVLLKAKEKDEVIEPEFKMEVGMVAFRDQDSLLRAKHRKADFKFLDFAVIR